MDSVAQSVDHEKYLTVSAFDGKSIWCVCNYAGDAPSDKAVLLGHGLTGHPNEYIHLAARDYFNERGYDVYRLAFYYHLENNRALQDCTVEIHAQDLNNVIAHIRPAHNKLYVCGHSYGGLTMVLANPDADAIAFWDASFYPWTEFWQSDVTPVPQLDCYKIGSGVASLIGEAMHEEAKNLTHEKTNPMAARITAPSIVIEAQNGGLGNSPKLFQALTCQKAFETIADADHCFNKGKTVYSLLESSHNWFKKF